MPENARTRGPTVPAIRRYTWYMSVPLPKDDTLYRTDRMSNLHYCEKGDAMDTNPNVQTYTLREAALRLGVAESTLRGAVRDGSLPLQILRLGDRTVIPMAALDDLLGGANHAAERAQLSADLARMQELLNLSVAVVTQMLMLQGALATVAAELADRAAHAVDQRGQLPGTGEE